MSDQYDLAVIGAGPGGYVAALRAAHHGLKVALIDKRATPGGTCLNVGCIPSKTLLHATELYRLAKGEHFARFGIRVGEVSVDLDRLRQEKDKAIGELAGGIRGLLKKAKVAYIEGAASFRGLGVLEVAGKEIRATHVIIATGSKVAPLKGVEADGDRIMTSTEALDLKDVPKRLVVVGAGFIGLEIASIYNRLGSEVTVLEYADGIAPGLDEEVAKAVAESLKKQGIAIQTGVAVQSARRKGDTVLVSAKGIEMEADRVLVAVGRVPVTDGLNLKALGITCDERGRIPVDAAFATSAKGVYAIGDVIAGPMLAHKAEEEGIACVDRIAGKAAVLDHDLIPSVMYTSPEAASVGLSEEQLVKMGRNYKKGVFPFLANSRARAHRETEGFVKILADAESDLVLGVHMLGELAGTMIAQAAQAMALGATSEDIAYTCQAHPTHSEAVREAALAVCERAIHL